MEDVDGDKLPESKLCNRSKSKWICYSKVEHFEFFRKEPGVYCIYVDGKLFYIGQSQSILKRTAKHRFRPHSFYGEKSAWRNAKTVMVKVRYTEKFGDWAMREIRLINRLRPIGNTSFNATWTGKY